MDDELRQLMQEFLDQKDLFEEWQEFLFERGHSIEEFGFEDSLR